MQCEMCGREAYLQDAIVEGTEMKICKQCLRFGKPIRKANFRVKEKKEKPRQPEEEIVEIVIANYNNTIKEKREELGMKQEDLAKKLNIKTSLLQSIESKKFKPNPDLAKQFEKLLKIKLVETYKEEPLKTGKPGSGGLTIGDVIRLKSKK